jgi:hypothetical protein
VLLAMAGIAGLLGNYPPCRTQCQRRCRHLPWLACCCCTRRALLAAQPYSLARGRELNLSPRLMKKHD